MCIRDSVYQTDQLKSLINVLGDDVSLDLTRFGDKAVSLKVKNGPVSVDYVLSDLSVISDVFVSTGIFTRFVFVDE